MITDDETLTEVGLPAEGQGSILLLACGALAREILAVKEANALDHMTLACLPAIYHNEPDRIVPAVKDAVNKHRDNYDQIFVVYADCGTGGLTQTHCCGKRVGTVGRPPLYTIF